MTTNTLDLSAETTQRLAARISGFLFLWLIFTGLAGLFLMSRVSGSGTLAETSSRIVASEHLYRLGLASELVETLSALILGFALYITLKPVDKLLSQFALFWRLGESLLGASGVVLGFAKLQLYTSPQSAGPTGTGTTQALIDFVEQAGSATTTISATFFSIGSILFFYLFLKSRYIPRVLSAFGIFASVVVTLMCFGILIFPEHAAPLQFGWAPMAIAEVTTGFWLMLFAVKTRPISYAKPQPAVIQS